MQPRPVVYVSRITNLSDARYCSGMGVDLLGYVVDPADPDYVSPETYQEFTGWISGPSRVIELGEAMLRKAEIREAYAPDYLHITRSRLNEIPAGEWKLIVELAYPDLVKVQSEMKGRRDVAYLLVTDIPPDTMAGIPAPASILLGARSIPGSALAFLERTGAAGIALQGSREVAPGLKDYDHLSQVLEELNG